MTWLLEEENPSVRYWTLQQIEGKAIGSKAVKRAQKAIMDSNCVNAILSTQKAEGHWGDFDDLYLPKYKATTHNLLILAELGAQRTPSIERSMEHVFLFQLDSGHFRTIRPKTDRGRASQVKDACCYDGNILYYMIHFGYLDDPRIQKLLQFQVDYHSDDTGGWLCRAFPIDKSKVFPINCFMGGVKLLRGLSKIPENKRSKDLKRIIEQEVEIILENKVFRYLRNPDGSRKDKAGWKRFRFPMFYQSDALEVLDVLTTFGIRDERMNDAIDLVLASRGTDGKWIMKDSFNEKMLCKIENKGEPSKWITLRALRVLKRYYSK
ncbi:MAG: hypothetical protein ACW97A_01665 [Candidatus Thorarchaeota archaeon]